MSLSVIAWTLTGIDSDIVIVTSFKDTLFKLFESSIVSAINLAAFRTVKTGNPKLLDCFDRERQKSRQVNLLVNWHLIEQSLLFGVLGNNFHFVSSPLFLFDVCRLRLNCIPHY